MSPIEAARLPGATDPDSLARKECVMRRTLRSLVVAIGLLAIAVAPIAIGSPDVQGTRVTALPSTTGDISVS
jgi:hypothetical protein